jgi:hypothetical protein
VYGLLKEEAHLHSNEKYEHNEEDLKLVSGKKEKISIFIGMALTKTWYSIL